jgi:two-component system, OmpR family, sensor histidine kinase MtrB
VWRRSIQARVVISTLLLSAVVVSIVGWVLLQQITSGLVESKTHSSVAEATRATAEAQGRLSAANGTDFDAGAQLTQLVSTLVSRGSVQGYEIVLKGPIDASASGLTTGAGTSTTPGVSGESIPLRLQHRVDQSTSGKTSYTYATIRYDAATGRRDVPGVVTGSQITLPADGGTYSLYYLFPMTEQENTLSLVRRALVTAGILLLLMVGGVTWLVTRQVVTPVRLARRVAERLASGRLEERMHVRGDDDIARLGTSFNQMAASLQRQIRQLEELSRVQRRFVSDVSHELRTPLTTVRMAGDVLHDARERFDGPTARAAELLQNELDRFELLLSDLLEISRFDAGAAVLDLEDVNLVDLAHRVVDSTRPLAERTGIHVVVRTTGTTGRPCVAEADARRVERIVRNLVTNAIDYAETTDVVVLVAANDHAAALAVRDYGVGLKPGEAAMVFNRFWRADPARARTSGGTGLGLSISLEDARLHGGWLQAWGEPGRGAQFRLTLPRLAGERIESSPLPLVPEDASSPLTASAP